MKPIIIEITEPITIDTLRECVEKAYETGVEDGRKQYNWITTTPSTELITPNPNPWVYTGTPLKTQSTT